jgi:hypothetical protein
MSATRLTPSPRTCTGLPTIRFAEPPEPQHWDRRNPVVGPERRGGSQGHRNLRNRPALLGGPFYLLWPWTCAGFEAPDAVPVVGCRRGLMTAGGVASDRVLKTSPITPQSFFLKGE